MTKSLNVRILMLLLAVLSTLVALTPVPPAQACPAYDVDTCYYPNGVSCRVPECPKHPVTCTGTPSGTPTCYYQSVECCI
jgi:hypothetical protein